MEKTCHLVCAGSVSRLTIPRLRSGDMIIAVDGGLLKLNEENIVPDLILGDFDSLGYVPDLPEVMRLPAEKDETDSWAAAMHAVELGFRRIILYGGVGGRTEHTIANIQLLAALAKRGVSAFLIDGGRTMTACDGGEIKIVALSSGYVSVFALDNACEGITLSGLKYPLDNYKMKNFYPIGVSNEFTGKPVGIKATAGTFLVVAECAPDDFL